MKPLVIVAAGGLAREAAAVVERSDEWDLVGFLDDRPELAGAMICGKPVLGGVAAAQDLEDVSFLVCAGKGQIRRALVTRLAELGVTPDQYATVIAPEVHVPRTCSVGCGSLLLSGTVLTTDVTVGSHVVTMPGVVLTHDNHVHDFATLCAHVTLGGNVHIREGAYLGMGALVREALEVGTDSVLGMGAVLLHDLPPQETWVGSPAHRVLANSASDSHP